MEWHKVLEPGELPDGHVKVVQCAESKLCMTHYQGAYGALDNQCPHQGGSLGEGTIQGGYLRCPWHSWEFHPLTGAPPGGYNCLLESYAVELRSDGVYVAMPIRRG